MDALVTRDRFDAVLFDLDGVITTTATLHQRAWQQAFDEFLERWDAEHGSRTPRFAPSDYTAYVDGKPRQEGVRSFLGARGLTLPEGAPDAPPDELSVWGIGNRKQRLFEDRLHRDGVEVFAGSRAWIVELRGAGFLTAVVSSSKNTNDVLAAAGITELFDARVDGLVIEELGMRGKPAPDGFLEAARRLGVGAARAVVVEDALAGVEAGRAGGFGLVIGVDRAGQRAALLDHGADVVVDDLAELARTG